MRGAGACRWSEAGLWSCEQRPPQRWRLLVGSGCRVRLASAGCMPHTATSIPWSVPGWQPWSSQMWLLSSSCIFCRDIKSLSAVGVKCATSIFISHSSYLHLSLSLCLCADRSLRVFATGTTACACWRRRGRRRKRGLQHTQLTQRSHACRCACGAYCDARTLRAVRLFDSWILSSWVSLLNVLQPVCKSSPI